MHTLINFFAKRFFGMMGFLIINIVYNSLSHESAAQKLATPPGVHSQPQLLWPKLFPRRPLRSLFCAKEKNLLPRNNLCFSSFLPDRKLRPKTRQKMVACAVAGHRYFRWRPGLAGKSRDKDPAPFCLICAQRQRSGP